MANKLQQPKSGNADLLRYAGLGTQMIIALGLAVFAGIKLDGWLHLKTPLAVWLLPLIVLSAILYSVIKESSKKEDKTRNEKKI
jgi:hypothetical protein